MQISCFLLIFLHSRSNVAVFERFCAFNTLWDKCVNMYMPPKIHTFVFIYLCIYLNKLNLQFHFWIKTKCSQRHWTLFSYKLDNGIFLFDISRRESDIFNLCTCIHTYIYTIHLHLHICYSKKIKVIFFVRRFVQMINWEACLCQFFFTKKVCQRWCKFLKNYDSFRK